MISARTIAGSAENYLLRIKTLAREHNARCVVVDPVSTWSQSGNDLSAHTVADRLIDWSKADGITLMCTSTFDEMTSEQEGGAPLPISSLVDTWIHLNYLMHAGERNRGLSIIKSRGTAHSNQVRELVLSDDGVTLADTYTAGGEVLMGTMRWQKERAERAANEAAEVTDKLKRVELDASEAEIEARLKALNVELVAKQIEKALLVSTGKSHDTDSSDDLASVRALRGADASTHIRR
jgi:circadian clock protein KaiC